MLNKAEYNGKETDREFSTYRTKYLIKSYIKSIKKDPSQSHETDLSMNLMDDGDILWSDGKRFQLMEQTVSRVVLHFTMCRSDEKEPMIAGDILNYLSGTNGRRTVYGILTEDSRG